MPVKKQLRVIEFYDPASTGLRRDQPENRVKMPSNTGGFCADVLRIDKMEMHVGRNKPSMLENIVRVQVHGR
ncbi:hypothetical protein ZHAS_00013158 [Anopheles sinensis]|uniref:Uncharacterized protein n=1 Tax=Anopheles sinensis TaxID=74873 RepID=A0A084W4Q1_ANOSI|nr:hypothetical protein ZHAS_00013158 [Anopheles sinensis]